MSYKKIYQYKKVFTLLCFFFSGFCFAQDQTNKYPFQNTNLSFEQRVNDLVPRLTLEEKVAQMLNSAPSITRLEIPAYDWWSEILHGVARTSFKVTVYPRQLPWRQLLIQIHCVLWQIIRPWKAGQFLMKVIAWVKPDNDMLD